MAVPPPQEKETPGTEAPPDLIEALPLAETTAVLPPAEAWTPEAPVPQAAA